MAESPRDDDAYAVLRTSHPLLRNIDKETLVQYMIFVTVWHRQKELVRKDRIFEDPFIVPLAQDIGEALFNVFPALRNNADGASYANLRAYCFDQALMHHDPAIRQVVFVANGLDTRAFRINELSDCIVYEIHTNPNIMAYKEKLFRDLHAECKALKRIPVMTKLQGEQWQNDLIAAGFDPKVPTFWILESTLQAIPPDDVLPLLHGVDTLSAPHSQMVTERIAGGGYDLEMDEDHQLELLVHMGLRYGEDGGVFRDLNWMVELLLRRNQAQQYYGTMWDEQRFERFRVTGDGVTVGPWFLVKFSKPE